MTRDSVAIAIEALSWMAYEGIGERTALFRAAKQLGIQNPSDLRQAHRLTMETTRFRNRLDAIVGTAAGEDQLKKAPHGIVSFLRILGYLRHVDGAPQRNIVRVVSWAREILGWRELHPFERSIALLASGRLNPYRPEMSELERIGLQTCHPAWFVACIIRHFGRDFALRILRRNLSQLPTFIRLNTLVTANPDRAAQVSEQIEGSRVPAIDGVWKMDNPSRIMAQGALIRSGTLVVQDLASIVAGSVTGAAPNHSVLDICAAPGNKTSHLAAMMNNQGSILSIDISGRRLAHWMTEMDRACVRIAETVRSDARKAPIRADYEADIVLLDAPCSNTGVFARNPNAKWTITPSRINDHIAKQRMILLDAADHVKPEGTLVYCTCSILPEENEFVIEDFRRRRTDFRLVPQSPFLGCPGLRGLELCQRFYPHLHDCNGYFIARLRRVS